MSWSQNPQDTFRGYVESMWQHKGGLHDIREVVFNALALLGYASLKNITNAIDLSGINAR